MYNLFKKLLPLLKKQSYVMAIVQIHLQSESTGTISIGGSSVCSVGHADHPCEDNKGFTCLTNQFGRHKHCFQKAYYKPRPNKFRQSKNGAYVAAITVCAQGPFLPIESDAPKT